jgi:hypothetical protein
MRAVAANRPFRPLALCALSLALSGGCAPLDTQGDGPYAFTAVDVLRDDCGLLPSNEGLWDGELRTAGDVLYMRYGLMEDMNLVGFFLGGGGGKDFMLDGSVSNVLVAARNAEQCLVDQVTVHLEGSTLSSTEFEGVLRLRYEPRPQDVVGCACELWVTYRAVQN